MQQTLLLDSKSLEKPRKHPAYSIAGVPVKQWTQSQYQNQLVSRLGMYLPRTFTLFHGTSSDVIDSILTNGLHPEPSRQWRIKIPINNYRPYVDDAKDTVSLTPILSKAEMFAEWRVGYLRANPATYFMPRGFSNMRWYKYKTAPQRMDVYPVVFQVTMLVTTENIAQFRTDEKAIGALALLYRGTIPPESLTLLTKPRQATRSRSGSVHTGMPSTSTHSTQEELSL